ncbi:MAG: hypothetical protein ACK4NS_10030 [Saprospiraceae bacterium]
MRYPLWTLLLLTGVSAMMVSGCASWRQNQWLAQHRVALQRIAASTSMSGEEKIDALAAEYLIFAKRTMQFVNPVKGAKYAQTFHDQNLKSIDKIIADSERWQASLNLGDKVSLGVRLTQKPYIRDYADLIPRIRQKYKQYSFLLNLTGKVAKGIGGLAGKALF